MLADAIDQFLASDADHAGVAFGGMTRILVARPLFVVYEVLPEDRLVRVLITGRTDQI